MSPLIKSLVIFAGIATCDIIKTSTVDLYLFSYSFDWFEVTQTTVPKFSNGSYGRKLDTVLNNIKVFMRGWLNYYGIAEKETLMKQWNEWLRRRIRMYI